MVKINLQLKINKPESLEKHRKIIRRKKFLRNIYLSFYQEIASLLTDIPAGCIIELGSGAGFIKQIIPNIVTSDIIAGSGIDKVFSADKIPFPDQSVSAFVMLDVFHHLKKPEIALRQMARCLKFGGKIVMIESFNSTWSRFIYKIFHREKFDLDAGWSISGKGRLSDANLALPWIVFVRDREFFQKKFPNLRIKKIRCHTPFRYLISGGLSKPQLVPTFIYPIILMVEKIISPFNKFIALFATIEIIKIK